MLIVVISNMSEIFLVSDLALETLLGYIITMFPVRKSALLIMTLVTFLTPLQANAVDTCEIIEAAINYRYATHEPSICAEAAYSEQIFCLRKSNDRYFLSTDRFEFSPPDINLEVPKLKPTIKLHADTKEQIHKARREVSKSRTTLDARKKSEKAETDGDDISLLLASFASSDMIGGYYDREIKRWSKIKGPTHPKVIELEEKYASHKRERKIADSKTTEQLKAEVEYVDRSNFDLLNSEYSKYLHIDPKITQVLGQWQNMLWQAPLDCAGKIKPKNPMLVERGEDLIVVQSGKIFKPYYNWHPQTFYAQRLALTPDRSHAIIQFSSHGGGSSYSLLMPLPMYLLEYLEGEWRVIASNYPVPTFY